MAQFDAKVQSLTSENIPAVSKADIKANFDAFYLFHSPYLGRFISRRIRSDSEDVLNEVFLIAWRKWKKLPTAPGEQKLWLFATARGVIANKLRLRSRLASHLKSTERLDEFNKTGVEQSDVTLAVNKALNKISPDHREVLMLIEWDGLATAEAAKVLNLPETTVTKRLHAARSTFEASFNS